MPVYGSGFYGSGLYGQGGPQLLSAVDTTPLIASDSAFATALAPPILSSVVASRISDTSMLITWTTNVPSNSQVEYGTTQVYGQFSTLDSTLVTAHSVTLAGLLPSTVYQYRVRSDG